MKSQRTTGESGQGGVWQTLRYVDTRLYIALAVVVVAVVAFVVWQMLASGTGLCLGSTSIGQILQNPDTYNNREVKLGCTVQRTFTVPLLGVVFIQCGDKTGEIWVRLAKKSADPDLPKDGQAVCIGCKVYKIFDVPGVGSRVTTCAQEEPKPKQ